MKALLFIAVVIGAVALLYTGVLPYRLGKATPTEETASAPELAPQSPPTKSQVTPNRAEKATAEAMRLYPALAQKNSTLNTAFLALYEQAKQTNPESLTAADWPLTLAARAASSLGIQPTTAKPTTPPPPPEPSTPPIRLVGHVVQHVPGGGLLIECRRAVVVASRMASVGGGGGVYSGDEGDVFGTFVLRGHPKESSLADDDSITTHGREDGMYQGDTVQGATRTIRAFRYAADPQAIKSSAPGGWKPTGSALDKKPR